MGDVYPRRIMGAGAPIMQSGGKARKFSMVTMMRMALSFREALKLGLDFIFSMEYSNPRAVSIKFSSLDA